MHTYREFSEETTRLIDMEVQRIIKEAEHHAIELLTRHRDRMTALVNALLESEDLERESIEKILGERPFPQPQETTAPAEAP
jgi:cell division protease FtsH